jgi:UDP-N-acetyl-D-glucosamine/UDP-N-acetyl-D-galactosamine dehydrogenase
VFVHDPEADAAEARLIYGVTLVTWDELPQADAIVVAVAHGTLLAKPIAEYRAIARAGACFVDVKSRFDMSALGAAGLSVWRL